MSSFIRECDAKRLLRDGGFAHDLFSVSVSEETDIEKLPELYPWLLEHQLVVKPDVLLKRRGASGLVLLNAKWDPTAKNYLKEKMNSTYTQSSSIKGKLTHFIIEPFITHDEEEEMYMAVRTLPEGDQILFVNRGGVNIGNVEMLSKSLIIPVNPDGSISPFNASSLLQDDELGPTNGARIVDYKPSTDKLSSSKKTLKSSSEEAKKDSKAFSTGSSTVSPESPSFTASTQSTQGGSFLRPDSLSLAPSTEHDTHHYQNSPPTLLKTPSSGSPPGGIGCTGQASGRKATGKKTFSAEQFQQFVEGLYATFHRAHFVFLELNPFIFDAKLDQFVILDAAAKLDHTAEFLCEGSLWKDIAFPSPFGRKLHLAEVKVKDLDSKTGASLKLTVLNEYGRLWMLIAGGGASVVYADTICDLGYSSELANYGEYSGAPTEITMFEYTSTILSLITQPSTYREEGKILLIGGGIANFTSVAETFRGIIRALTEFRSKLIEFKVKIYVRRGGPNYQAGLKLMKEKGTELGFPIKVYGPETYITAIVGMALGESEAADGWGMIGRDGGSYSGSRRRENGASNEGHLSTQFSVGEGGMGGETSLSRLPDRTESWHETRMEDVESDPNIVNQIKMLSQRGEMSGDGGKLKSGGRGGSGGLSEESVGPLGGVAKGASLANLGEGVGIGGVEGCRTELSPAAAGVDGGRTQLSPIAEPFANFNVAAKRVRLPPLFDQNTRCFVWGLQTQAVQEMLDFDHVCGRKEPSVAAIIYEFSVSHLRPFYFGTEEVFIPVFQSLNEAIQKFPDPNANVFINFASMRSAAKVTHSAMDFPQIKTIAVIAEGVPERQTRELISHGKISGTTLIGPATVGGIKPGCLRIGNTGGSLENIMNAKLYRPGTVGFVTKSGGMLNELNNILAKITDGAYEGIAIGGDRFPGTTMLDHILRFEDDDNISMIVVLGEIGGLIEYDLALALQSGRVTKPLVAWCVGTCADEFVTEVPFGHAGAWASSNSELATSKNAALASAGAHVPKSFHGFGAEISKVFQQLVASGAVRSFVEPEAPRVPMDYDWAKKLGLVRRPKGFISSISDDRGEELVYAGWPISKVIQSDMNVGGVISLLWFKRPLPDYCYRYLERVLMLTADHGPAVCGAHNCIVTARAGKDLISSLISGLCTIGDRFGGACDMAAQQFLKAFRGGITPEAFVSEMKKRNELIMGIGHKIKSIHNPDMRVQLLKRFCRENFPKTGLIEFAEAVEKLTTKKKDTLILNVDGLIGVSMCDMLYSCGAFTESEALDYIENGCINGLFVLGRSIGFIGHYLDQKRLKQGLYRHDVDDISYVLPDLGRQT